ncbi:hypothetical protein [Acidithiobacillus ferridurans]|jgi:hypothetical protein|uniref:Uncharacterized protein n=2 Tax=Acidithiobacillus ferridurans TaxID=1232575 RepID=A0A2Z6INX5_ACIFI|nr:hypothetical protein [Acidithiobacillus ferridurans]MBU2715281.1 hypothetical protein [Acidithiobacillus ferridurans]MBU2723090.1 hypothetical protein [Acidithiobacillus ferridurans]MBU2725962.1 hypothetical protein [Acidithiobacillus ferridurans]BBF66373.1 hypothetical protein AFERRID_25910 [Acidithiobacillus ferridurans]
MVEKKTRIRRSAEQRLADLEKKQLEIMERQKAAIAKIEEEKKRLLKTPSARKERVEQEKRFARALQALAPEWDMRHVIAAVELAIAEDMERLVDRGEKLLEEHGKARRGRRPRGE